MKIEKGAGVKPPPRTWGVARDSRGHWRVVPGHQSTAWPLMTRKAAQAEAAYRNQKNL